MNSCHLLTLSCREMSSSWSIGSSFGGLGSGIPEASISNAIEITIRNQSLFNLPSFWASPNARRLIPIPTSAWTTADHVGVKVFCHTSSISLRHSSTVLQSCLIASNLGFLTPRWRPKVIQSLTSCNSVTRSTSSIAVCRKCNYCVKHHHNSLNTRPPVLALTVSDWSKQAYTATCAMQSH